jgi:hypothetical protein
MKKILRLVTTSVLTLTLVACGEASSSVSSSVSSTPASSVSSTTSAFANVSTITLSAASDALTQVVGAQKNVVVSATLNQNTNPSLALEWFVNGVKSNQTGRVFEYAPLTAGTFKISARASGVNSNEITVTVGQAVLTISKLEVISGSKIEITAPAGAEVAVTNNEVLPTSYFDLKKGIYVLDLKTPLIQGASATVTLTRLGSSTVSQVFTFDTRKVEITGLAGAEVTDNEDGTYDIKKPHDIAPGASGGANTTVETYNVSFGSTNLKSTSVGFTVTRLSAPTGAAAFTSQSGFISVASDVAETASGGFQFSLNKDTTPGAYVYRYTLGQKSVDFTINVVDPQPEITLDPVTAKQQAAVYNPTTMTEIPTYLNTEFNLKYVYTWAGGNGPTVTNANKSTSQVNTLTFGVPANTDKSFDIVKDYLALAADGSRIKKTFSFEYVAANFSIPENLVTQTSVAPNQVMVSLVGPDGLSFMRTQSGEQQDTNFLTPATFRANIATPRAVTQIVDAATVAGKYTYTIKVLQSGIEIYSTNVVVNVKEPVAKLDFTATQLDHSEYVNMFNDLFKTPAAVFYEELLVKNSHNSNATAFNTTLAAEFTDNKEKEAYKLFSDKIQSILVPPVIANAYSEATHELEKAKWVKSFYENYAYPARGASPAEWGANVRAFIAKFVPTLEQVTAIEDIDGTANGDYEELITDYMLALVHPSNTVLATAIGTLHSNAGTSAAQYILDSAAPAQPTQGNYDTEKAAWDLYAATLYPPYFGNINNVRLFYKSYYDLTWDRKVNVVDLAATEMAAYIALTSNSTHAPALRNAFYDIWEAYYEVGSLSATTSGNTTTYGSYATEKLAFFGKTDNTSRIKNFPAYNETHGTWETNVKTFVQTFAPTKATLDGITTTDLAGTPEYLDLVNEQVQLFFSAIGLTSDIRSALTISSAGAVPTITEGQYDYLKLKYDQTLNNLFPKNSTPDVAKAAEADKVTFKIEKPRAAGLDSKTLAFNVKVSNIQSLSSPLAAVGDSFTSQKTGSAKSEFLTFTKSLVGPGEVRDNTALNTATTKLALELGSTASIKDILTLNLSDTTTKYNYFASTTDSLTLNDVFTFEVDFLTVTGIYTINVRVGNVTQQIKVEVVDAAPKVNMGLASDSGFVKNATDGKFYKTQASTIEAPSVTFTLQLLNLEASATAAYTLEKIDFENNSVKTSNTIVTTTLPGNDGHSESVALLNLLGTNGVATTTLPEPGEYVWNLTVGGVTSSITLVLNEYPTLKVNSAKVGTTTLPVFDGVYLYNGGAGGVAIKFDFVVEAVSFTTNPVYYKISRAVLSNANITSSILPTNTLAQNVTAAGVTALTFKDEVASLSYTLPAGQIDAITGKNLVNFDGANVKVSSAAVVLGMIVVQLYVFDNVTDPTTPIFKFIGHRAIFVGNADLLEFN